MLAVSLGLLVALVLSNRHVYWAQTDADIYRSAGSSLWHSDGSLYDTKFGAVQYPFTYPPFAAIVFSAFAFLAFAIWQWGLAGVGIAAMVWSIVCSLRVAGRPVRLAPVLLITAGCLWLEPVDLTLYFGQVNLIVLALVLGDLALRDDSRWKGIGIGVAAAIKLTPLIFVLYLWLTGRRRAATTSAAVFVGIALVALAVRPHDSIAFWRGDAFDADDARNSVNQSLNGLLQRLLGHGGAASTLWLLGSIGVVAAGLGFARRAWRVGDELLAVTLVAVAGLLVSPISWTHHYVWVVPIVVLAIVRLKTGWALGPSLMLGTVIVVFAWWPLPVAGPDGGYSASAPWHPAGLLRSTAHNHGLEWHWNVIQFLSGNLYVWAALAFLGYGIGRAGGARAAPAERSS